MRANVSEPTFRGVRCGPSSRRLALCSLLSNMRLSLRESGDLSTNLSDGYKRLHTPRRDVCVLLVERKVKVK
jgi:hypothetical protein